LTPLICDVCPRSCKLEEGETGFCNVRKNVAGKNVDALYGLFYPNPEEHNALGSYTVVFPGCNLKCWFCCYPFVSSGFTGDTSQWPTGTYRKLSPREFAERVRRSAGPDRGGFTCGMGGFFGGEPALHYEYIIEASRMCHDLGCISKLHTNGYVSEQVMRDLSRAVDVVSINVKGSATSYERMGADPTVVLRSIKVAWENRPTRRSPPSPTFRNIIGPDLEPTDEETSRFGKWLSTELDPSVEVLVEPLMTVADHFEDLRDRSKSGLWPEGNEYDTNQAAIRRTFRTAGTLHAAGLKNVLVLCMGGARLHVPTLQWRL
jgi:pyruvate formate lyase activating enzyme